MIYLIGQLAVPLLLTMLAMVFAGWMFAAERAAPKEAAAKRERENLLRDLIRFTGDGPVEREVDLDAAPTQRLLEIRDGRNAELEHNLKGIWQLHDVVSDLNKKNDQFINNLRSQLEEKQRQLVAMTQGRNQLDEQFRHSEAARIAAETGAAQLQQAVDGLRNDAEVASAKLIQTGQELELLRANATLLTDQLQISEADAAELAQALEEKRINIKVAA